MNQGVHVHGIDLIQWMMGDIASVFAHTAALVRDIKVEDTAVVIVKFKNGHSELSKAQLWCIPDK